MIMESSKVLLSCAALFVVAASIQACVPVAAGLGQGFANQKTPPAETAANCESWECWDGYKCGVCPQEAPQSEPKKK
jgi:hypothetical protein